MKQDKGISTSGIVIAAVVVVAIAIAVVVTILSDPFGASGPGLSEPFTYDVTELLKVDPALIAYRRVRAIETGLDQPRGIALDDAGRLYVAGDESIVVFDQAARIATIDLDAAPQAVAPADDGKLYVAMADHVQVFGRDGKRLARWASLGENARVKAIAVGPANVFLADAGRRIVLRCDLRGEVLGRIGEKDERQNIPGLLVPSEYMDLAMGADGLLRVTNPGRRLVETYTLDGQRELWFGRSSAEIDGFFGCCNPTNIAITQDGQVVTSEKGLPRVKLYSADGTFLAVVAAPDQFGDDASGLDLAVGSDGKIYVLDPPGKRVLVFEPKLPSESGS